MNSLLTALCRDFEEETVGTSSNQKLLQSFFFNEEVISKDFSIAWVLMVSLCICVPSWRNHG